MSQFRRCPSTLQLEEYLLGLATPATLAHVSVCSPCEARLLRMRLLGQEFERTVLPATLSKVVAGKLPVRAPAGSGTSEDGPLAANPALAPATGPHLH